MEEEDATVVYWDVIGYSNGVFTMTNGDEKDEYVQWTEADVIEHGLEVIELKKTLALKGLKTDIPVPELLEGYIPIPDEVWKATKHKSPEETKNDFMAVSLMMESLRIYRGGLRGRCQTVAESMIRYGFCLGHRPADKISNKYSSLLKSYRTYKKEMQESGQFWKDPPLFFELIDKVENKDGESSPPVEVQVRNSKCGETSTPLKIVRRKKKSKDWNFDDSGVVPEERHETELIAEVLGGYTPLQVELWQLSKLKSVEEARNDNSAIHLMLELCKKYKEGRSFRLIASEIIHAGFNLGPKPADKVSNKCSNLLRVYRLFRKEIEETGTSKRAAPPFLEILCELEGDTPLDIEKLKEISKQENVDENDVEYSEETSGNNSSFSGNGVEGILNGYKPLSEEVWLTRKNKRADEIENDTIAVQVLLVLLKKNLEPRKRFSSIATEMIRAGFNLGSDPGDKATNKYQNLVRAYRIHLKDIEDGVVRRPPPMFADLLAELEIKPLTGLTPKRKMHNTTFVSTNDAESPVDDTDRDDTDSRSCDDSTLPVRFLKRKFNHGRSGACGDLSYNPESVGVQSTSSKTMSRAHNGFENNVDLNDDIELASHDSPFEEEEPEGTLQQCLERLANIEKRQNQMWEGTETFHREILNEMRTAREERAVREEKKMNQMERMLELLGSLVSKPGEKRKET